MSKLSQFYLLILSEKYREFHQETRCVLNLFEQGFDPVHNDLGYRMIIEIYPTDFDFEKYNSNFNVHTEDKFIVVPLIFDTKQYLLLTEELEKKQYALDLLMLGVEKFIKETGWDISPFKKAYEYVLIKNFVNHYIYTRKVSPSRKWIAEIFCEHGMKYFDIYLIIRDRSTNKIIKKEKVKREAPNEMIFNNFLGQIKWKKGIGNQVEYFDKLGRVQHQISIG